MLSSDIVGLACLDEKQLGRLLHHGRTDLLSSLLHR